jgi:CRISPR-associated endonuclease Csn1
VVPANLCFEKPALEESAYGQRQTPEFKKPVATKRYELKKLGYTGINPVFKLDTLKKHVATILDPVIRQAIQAFIQTNTPTADAWQAFCAGFRQPGRTADGPFVKAVRRVVAEDLEEFTDLSKGDRKLNGERRPALRRGDRHRGYFLYSDTKNKIRVRPVYVFQSIAAIRQDLLSKQGSEVVEIIGFFQSGCAVALDAPVDHPKTPLAAGTYKLNSIWASGFVKVTSASGVLSQPISAAKLLQAGLRRI